MTPCSRVGSPIAALRLLAKSVLVVPLARTLARSIMAFSENVGVDLVLESVLVNTVDMRIPFRSTRSVSLQSPRVPVVELGLHWMKNLWFFRPIPFINVACSAKISVQL
ncbi:hypothetical protein D915_004499 [Fasciola hepatica]|uniref:Secreted protein n=1 Tax=Fasciola hepatica TaxID=6192 RepID=A0A4E0RC11_FASHE|nr:hypothetical protein D915_004499 [Fasciola hepatica]